MSHYRIVRDDGQPDTIVGQVFATYDAAYAVLERYYADLCCSDKREYYSIEENSAAVDSAAVGSAAGDLANGREEPPGA
jgi:hypothetical protein